MNFSNQSEIRIGNKFIQKEKLGSGAFGEVYKGIIL